MLYKTFTHIFSNLSWDFMRHQTSTYQVGSRISKLLEHSDNSRLVSLPSQSDLCTSTQHACDAACVRARQRELQSDFTRKSQMKLIKKKKPTIINFKPLASLTNKVSIFFYFFCQSAAAEDELENTNSLRSPSQRIWSAEQQEVWWREGTDKKNSYYHLFFSSSLHTLTLFNRRNI